MSGGRLGGGGIEQKGKGTHGHDNSVVIAGVGGHIRELNGNGKNTIKSLKNKSKGKKIKRSKN